MNCACQFREAGGLEHWVAAAEGDVGIGIRLDDLHDVADAHLMSLVKGP